MNAITNWQLSVSGLGAVNEYDSEFYYAGGIAVVGFGGGGGTSWAVFNLGNGNVALMVTLTDQDGTPHNFYWNSHYGTTGGEDDNGMTLWNGTDNYSSTSIGQEQTFKLVHMGGGNVAFQATGGAFAGQYLGGESGGWYPDQWSLGSGSILASASPVAFQVSGDLLPILVITNSGYDLNLAGRSLAGLNLDGADMRQCQLSNADLSQIIGLQNANFTGAILRGASLSGLQLAGANWTQADFTGSDLTAVGGAAKAQMTQAVFNDCKLADVHLGGAALAGAQFHSADLSGADLTGADLTGADLTGATLKGTDFRGAILKGTLFNGCDLSTAQFDPSPQFTRSATGRTTFNGATVPFQLLGTNWSWLDLTNAVITGIPTSIPSLVADGALLPSGLNLEKVGLAGASFAGTRMYEIQLQSADLQGANLAGALLKGAKLNGANLTMANLNSAWLIAEQTGPARPPAALDQLEAAVATNAVMFNTVLDGAHCDGVDFSGATFVTAASLGTQQASAVGASMNFAKFDGAAVVLAVFDGAQLSASDFSRAVMVGASFQDNGSQATQLNPSSDSTHTPASIYQADIRGTNFKGANMDGLDMREAVVSTTGGQFTQLYKDFYGNAVPVAFDYGSTKLGNTTVSTTCPDGSTGPCNLGM